MTTHTQMIAKLVSTKDLQTGLFMKKLRTALLAEICSDSCRHSSCSHRREDLPEDNESEPCCKCAYDYELGPGNGVIPDAFSIDAEGQSVVAYEVVVTNGIDRQKMGKYERIAWVLDEFYWSIAVVVVNEAGSYCFDPWETSLQRDMADNDNLATAPLPQPPANDVECNDLDWRGIIRQRIKDRRSGVL